MTPGRTDDIDVRAFPSRDTAFQADVQAAIARSRASVLAGRQLVEAVRCDLAERYPSVRIEEQKPLASLDGGTRWYVYRDGKIA